jgi:GNAT superfamily N-acetyltransferase
LLTDADWERLPPLFAIAFQRVQPFARLVDEVRLQAAEDCLRQTKEGAEGPSIAQASFVAPLHARLGVGSALLDAVAQGLNRLGYTELASTFLLGNESSTLWHWRVGFRLLPYRGTMRLIRGERLPP